MSEAKLVGYLPADIYQPLERLFQYPDNLCNDSDRKREVGSLVYQGVLWNVTYYWYDTCVENEHGYTTGETVKNLAMLIFSDKQTIIGKKTGKEIVYEQFYSIGFYGDTKENYAEKKGYKVPPLKDFLAEATYDTDERVISDSKALQQFEKGKQLCREKETIDQEQIKADKELKEGLEKLHQEQDSKKPDDSLPKPIEKEPKSDATSPTVTRSSSPTSEDVDKIETPPTSSGVTSGFSCNPYMVLGLGLLGLCTAYFVCRYAIGVFGLGPD